MKSIIAVFVGGGIGSVMRFLLAAVLQRSFPGIFPWGTLAVNIAGSLLLGIFAGLASRSFLSTEWRMFLAIGLCGGFTTFSTFSLEVAELLRTQYTIALLYIATSVLAGIGAIAAGLWLARP